MIDDAEDLVMIQIMLDNVPKLNPYGVCVCAGRIGTAKE